MNNDFLGHSWCDLPMIFTRDFVTRENYWQIASLVTQKSLFTVTNALFFISNELDIIIHVTAPQLSGDCDVISNWLWRHQQNENRASETRGRSFLSSLIDSLYRVRNEIMYVLSWRTVCALTRMLFWCLFPSVLRNSGNKHQNNTLVSTETVRHTCTYIILYIFHGT